VIGSLSGFGNPVEGDPVGGLAFGSNGVLYGLAMRGTLLLTINPATGHATPVGPAGTLSIQGAVGLAFDPSDGTMYMTDGEYLYTVNTANGAATLIGDPHIGSYVNGLAIKPSAVPEPPGWALVVSGGLFLIGTRARRRRSS
jgi:hypothetical protein